ncbi:hydroxymethylglutaryl-CoA synthase [Brenneria tiliae]|uniref:Hydroxymethylglutaryl-CoA synthase n=1 Tax=Brenneria tiliae TaxID=2914984 RepID=A0ABT0MZ54_9GAMM|nr:hydroxymethylglutaryl-CoA synthase [Brenneria tiliae]MCL2895047.1 hydroxymethylglutaryl-CoA synthase [Brenneria tiliae]
MQSTPGITSYGFSLPLYRIKVEDIINVWKNTAPDIITQTLGTTSRTVLQPDEDTITLSLDAARQALRRANISTLDAIYLGTCTNPYDSRSSAAILLEMLGAGKQAFCADIQFSGKSGTSAMQICHAMITSGLANTALAIGADVLSRHVAPGDLTESYAGAAAAAILFGKKNVIAEIDATFSCAEDLADNIRPQGERYIRSGMGLGSDKNNLGINKHMAFAFHGLLSQTETCKEDYSYVVFQQPTISIVHTMTKKLGLSNQQTSPALYADTVGDTGASSPMLGLAKILDIAKPGEKILVVSYGFGAGSDAISFTVTNNILSYRKNHRTVQSVLKEVLWTDYGTATKYEFKFLRPDYALTAYL